MYGFLFSSLNPVLRVAVGAYVIVIALMAAQAIGRAVWLRDKASVAAAIGACFFMLSDSLLATNKFAVQFPMAQFLVLATYYVAQILIAKNAGAVRADLSYSENNSPALFGGVTPR
jgi:alkylglycerol monooxygenase